MINNRENPPNYPNLPDWSLATGVPPLQLDRFESQHSFLAMPLRAVHEQKLFPAPRPEPGAARRSSRPPPAPVPRPTPKPKTVDPAEGSRP